jgi:hypothetical protein
MSCALDLGPAADSCEYWTEYLRYKYNAQHFFYQLSDNQFLNDDYIPWRFLCSV